MNIIEKIDALRKRFDESIELFNKKQEELIEIQDEQKIMQGEYKALLELGLEMGLLDENGNTVEAEKTKGV